MELWIILGGIVVAVIIIRVLVEYFKMRKQAKINAERLESEPPVIKIKLPEDLVTRVIAALAEISSKDIISLKPYRTPEPLSVYDSKFGGVPYLPPDFVYPTGTDRFPLRLLAQFNFDKLPHIPNYPESGILQFYIAQDDCMGLDFKNPISQADSRVVYHDNIITDESKLQSPPKLPKVDGEDSYFPFEGEFALEVTAEKQAITPGDFRFEKMVSFEETVSKILKQYGDAQTVYAEIEDELWETISENDYTNSQLGGYPYFTQQDPRDDGNFDDYELLFQMDSYFDRSVEKPGDRYEIIWGDSGVANFFITAEDLKARDFSKVMYNWDCC